MPQEEEDRSGSVVPVPDPTRLTTAALLRAIADARELFEAKLDVIVTRLGAMDKASELLHENLIQIPTISDRQINHLRELMDDRFSGIDKQFAERDVRTEQAAIATKIAVDAALQAQKEAAGAQNESNTKAIEKSEAATAKQIDGITALIRSQFDGLNDKIVDLRGRLDRGEGSTSGSQQTRTDHRLDIGTVISAIAVSVAIGALFFGFHK